MTVVSAVAGIGVVVAGAGGVAAFASPSHTVTLNVDGASRVVTVHAETVGDALADAGIHAGSDDQLVPARTSQIGAHTTITLVHAQPAWVMPSGQGTAKPMSVPGTSLDEQLLNVRQDIPQAALSVSRTPKSATTLPLVSDTQTVTVHVDGEAHQITAGAGATCQAVLEKAGLAAGPLDQVSVSLDGQGNPSVTVNRISRQGVSEETEIPFETEEKQDDTLFEGQRIVDTEGVTGLKRTTYAVESDNGQESRRTVVKEEIVRQPVKAIVRVGTKPLPTSEAVSEPVVGHAAVPAGDAQQMALAILPEFGFSADQFSCLQTLWTRESGWSSTATNPSSGAYGIPQALPGSKMASVGADWRTNPATQIRWGLGYIKGRYGTPCQALSSWNAKGWY
ncbi:MAG: G5 domain-containing protein [Actinomycetaceae bacterium]|nr:G5 domain-containing protein [Actinomycetaceae bacterium]MDU0970681.1 G5 domain-containing protein [Actinomycetaceae bacterium]